MIILISSLFTSCANRKTQSLEVTFQPESQSATIQSETSVPQLESQSTTIQSETSAPQLESQSATIQSETPTPQTESQHTTTQSEISSIVSDIPKEDNKYSKDRLIVKGVDISTDNNVCVNSDCQSAEFSITAVAEKLGATIERKDHTITISFEQQNRNIDLASPHFGLLPPPGHRLCVRRITGNDVIIDSETANVYFLYWWGISMNIDYEKRIVEIY